LEPDPTIRRAKTANMMNNSQVANVAQVSQNNYSDLLIPTRGVHLNPRIYFSALVDSFCRLNIRGRPHTLPLCLGRYIP
jgi:hypothetical protein